MSDDEMESFEDLQPGLPEAAEPEPQSRWLPEGRTLKSELRQLRYLILAVVAVTIILLQIWVLF